eukprot:scaffold1282_cov251-Pinguiococcus_pyrenoidosus.AAC.72
MAKSPSFCSPPAAKPLRHSPSAGGRDHSELGSVRSAARVIIQGGGGIPVGLALREAPLPFHPRQGVFHRIMLGRSAELREARSKSYDGEHVVELVVPLEASSHPFEAFS